MNFWNVIMTEKNWAWSIVALVWLIVMLIVRHLLLRYIFAELKKVNKEIRAQVQQVYLPRSILGWLLLVLGVALGTVICLNPMFMSNYMALFQLQVICIAILAGSVFAHTHAYTYAILKVMTERFGVEKVS